MEVRTDHIFKDFVMGTGSLQCMGVKYIAK